MSSFVHRARAASVPKLLLWSGLGYGAALLVASLIGSEILLRSKTHWVKGEFLPVRRRGDVVYLPATPEAQALGPLGVVPLGQAQGHVLLGAPRKMGRLIERRVLGEQGHVPDGWAWVSGYVYNGTPAQLGLAFESVGLRTPVGKMPAWSVPPRGEARDALIIAVHGHGGQRAQFLRMLPAMLRTGCGVLMTTFRNAHGAPMVNSGYLTLGDSESEDLLAALHWGAAQGYKRVILYGLSMGGNISLNVLRPQFALPLPVVGIMLDSPALDWRGTLHAQARRFGVPKVLARPVARLTEYAATRRSGLDFDAVDQLAAAQRLSVPVIVWHGTHDRTIPVAQAAALAAARPDLVEFHRVQGPNTSALGTLTRQATSGNWRILWRGYWGGRRE